MITPHRPSSALAGAPQRRGVVKAAALTLACLLAVSACSSEAPEGPSQDVTAQPDDTATGIPQSWAAAISDGKERYPGIGSTGQGDVKWICPFTETIQVDGKTMGGSRTTFWKLSDGLFEVECSFYPPTPAGLRFAQAEDDAAYAVLEESTNAFRQQGNEQVQDAVTIGARDYVLVTWTYPTNPAAGTKVVACYLDATTRSRACLEVADSDARSDDYDAHRAAEDLAAFLAAAPDLGEGATGNSRNSL